MDPGYLETPPPTEDLENVLSTLSNLQHHFQTMKSFAEMEADEERLEVIGEILARINVPLNQIVDILYDWWAPRMIKGWRIRNG
jgi:hypothetical protein